MRSVTNLTVLSAVVFVSCTRYAPAPMLPRSEPRAQSATTTPTIPLPAPPVEEAQPIDELRWPDVQEARSSQGAELRVVQLPGVPLVHLRVVFPVGWKDRSDMPGLARMTAYSLVEGAMGQDAPTQRWQGLEQVADASAHVTANATVFSLRFMTTDAEEVIDHVHGMLTTPGFRRSSLQRARETFNRRVRDQLLVDAFQGVAADSKIDGPALLRIKGWHCRALHKARYDATKARVVWVGDISSTRASTLTERMFEGWKAPRQQATRPPSATAEARESSTSNSGEVWAAIVAQGPESVHEDWPALWLAAQAMTEGCPALPWVAPTSKGFRLCARMDATQVESWQQQKLQQLAQLGSEGLDEQALEAAKRSLVLAEATRLANPRALADTLTVAERSQVDGVGARVGDVVDVSGPARRHLQPEQLTLLVVGVEH